MVVGLTGGIGSGKTLALSFFKELGIEVYESDVEAKLIMNTNLQVKRQIIELLGDQAYVDSVLNRPYIASKVFNNKDLLGKLNNIVHPAVKKDFLEKKKKSKTPYFVYESAILLQSKTVDLCDKIVCVVAAEEERILRVVLRSGIERSEVVSRIKNQMSDEERVQKSDYVLENNKGVKELKDKVVKFHKELLLNR